MAIGLILNIVPLLVSTVEHWKDGTEPLGRFVNFDNEYRKFYEDLKDEQLVLRLHLKKLLRPLVKEGLLLNNDIDLLLSNVQLEEWRQPAVNAALEKRLGEACERYIEALRSMQNSIVDLLHALDSGKAGLQSKLIGGLVSVSILPTRVTPDNDIGSQH